MRLFGHIVFGGTVAVIALGGCSSSNSVKANTDGGTTGGCANPPALTDDDYCKTCSFPAGADPTACTPARNVNACCAWVAAPTNEVAAGTGLHNFSNPDPSYKPNLACLTTPPQAGTPQTVTMKGHVKLFSSGGDSAGVKIEIFKEGPNHDGAVGALVGSAFVTSKDDMMDPADTVTWLNKCPPAPDGCKFRSFTYAGVPTETPLIIKTSDAAGGANPTWADLYDYNIYFSNDKVDAQMNVAYDPSALASSDIGVVAATVGASIKAGKGLIAGEVHDCADVRLSGATVDSDEPHEGQMFYFTDNEADPLPDNSKTSTSRLGLFGAINFPTGVPIRLSAVGKSNGNDVLLGTYVVQTFAGAVTALSFRGRRPSQK